MTNSYVEWKNNNYPGFFNPPINNYYTEIPVNLEKQQIGLLVGKNGYFFKSITSITGVSYIWYDSNKNVVKLWSCNERNLFIAVDKIKERMNYVKKNILINIMTEKYNIEFPVI